MKRHRVKAFTIMEVVVTMAVSAILIGITYTSYRILSGSYASFHTRNEELSKVEKLDELFKKDFNRAVSIERSDTGLLIRGTSASIRYEIMPEAIIRVSSERDTFRVRNQGAVYSFEGQLIDNSASDTPKRIDEMAISLLLENEPISLRYHKSYSAVNLFNPDPDAIN